MAPSVATFWQASFAAPITATAASLPPPPSLGSTVAVAMPAGDWAVALVTWRQPPALPGVDLASVADDQHSWWEPLGAPHASSSASGVLRTAAWFCPRSRASTMVQACFTGAVLASTITVLDITGMTDWILSAFTPQTSTGSGTTLTVTGPAPASSAILFATGALDNLAATLAGPGAGWTALTAVTAANGTDHTSDLASYAGWQVTSGTSSATWTSSAVVDITGLIAGLIATPAALTQPNPNWPIVLQEAAPGAGEYTPAGQVTWQAMPTAIFDLAFTQGRSYTTATLTAGQGTLTADNPAGLMLPPAFSQSAGIDAGTPVRTRCYWPGGAWQVQFNGDGIHSGIGAGSTSSGGGFATPGVTYSVSMSLGMSAAWPSGANLKINFYNGSLTLLQTFTATQTATTVAPTVLSVSGLAPVGTAFWNFQVPVNGIPPASIVFSAQAIAAVTGPSVPLAAWTPFNANTTLTILAPWAPDRRGPPNATPWYMVQNGFIERLPQAQDNQYRGVTEATIVDPWASLQVNMNPILVAETLLNDNPVDYWPCTDVGGQGGGTQTASNLGPAAPDGPLTDIPSKYGAGNVKSSFGQNQAGIPGEAGQYLIGPQFRVTSAAGMWGVSGINVNPVNFNGRSLTGSSSTFPRIPLSGSGNLTLEFWFDIISPYSQVVAALATVLRHGQFGSPFSTPNNGLFQIVVQPTPSTSNLNVFDGTVFNSIGVASVDYNLVTTPTHVAIVFNRTGYTGYVNGVAAAPNNWTSQLPTSFEGLSFNGIAASNSYSVFSVGDLENFNGYTGGIALYNYGLTQQRIVSHYLAGITGFAGETAPNRYERIILNSGNGALRRIIQPTSAPTLDQVASCLDQGGNPAGQAISNIASNLTPGVTIVTPNGEIFALAKQNAFGQATKWTLGELVANGEYPYTGDVTLEYDPQRVVNSIQYTQLDNQDVVTSQVPAVTAASQLQYGQISLNATGYLQGDLLVGPAFGPGLVDLANWQAEIYGKPLMRGGRITVDAAQHPASWPLVLGAACADMVQINRRPIGTAGTIGVTGRISQTQRRLVFGYQGPVAGSLTMIIDAAPEQNVLTVGDPVKGVLNGTNILGW